MRPPQPQAAATSATIAERHTSDKLQIKRRTRNVKSKAIRDGIIRAGRGWCEYEARGRVYHATTPSRLWRMLCRVGVDPIAADEISCAVRFLVDEVEVAR
jgi:hypothetical protein